MATLEDVLSRIPGIRKSGEGWRAPCPAHGGEGPNLSISEGESGKVLFTCHSKGCSYADIMAAIGLGQGPASYIYRQPNGAPQFQVVRRYDDGKKSFRQYRIDPVNPELFIPGMNGMEPILFHLPELIKGVAEGKPVLIVEGEKDVLTAESLGFIATTNPGGANKWRESYNAYFQGAHVVILPDNDKPGRDHADKVAKALQGVAASIKIITLPGLPEKGDLTDWVECGGIKEDIIALINIVPTTGDEPLPIFLTNRMEVPEGLARDFLYPGGVTLVAAPAGIGKSVVSHILARELASGGIFRGARLDKCRVLLIDTDNPRVMLQDRLSKVCIKHEISLSVRTRDKNPPLSDAEWWKALPINQYDVVILDSFGGATPGISEKEAGPYQKAIGVIRDMADRGPAVLVLDNTTKTAENYRGRGEKIERFDVVYECRDVTGWEPTRADWWAALPEAGDSFWQERATRRKGAKKIRLAFMARKFRWDEEPDPFVLEVSFDTVPWSLEDITEAIDQQAQGASLEQKREHQLRQLDAVHACVTEIKHRIDAGKPVMSKAEAEAVMIEASGLTRAEIRRLLDAHDANIYPSDGRWRIESTNNRKKAVLGL